MANGTGSSGSGGNSGYDPSKPNSGVGGSDQSVNYSDPAQAWKTQNSAFNQGMGALQQQATLADQATGAWDQALPAYDAASAAGLQQMRTQAAQSLAGSRGSLGGGRGLALGQQAAATSGQAYAKASADAATQRASLAQQRISALTGAAQQKYQALGEQNKMLQERARQGDQAANAHQRATDIINSEKGMIFTTVKDRQRMIDRINSEVLAGVTDPNAIRDVQNIVNELQTGNYSDGKINI